MTSKKILIIDDNTQNLQVAMNILNKSGYSLLYAQDGNKGIDIAKKHDDIGLILLDVLMPEIDGFDVCKILKEDDKTREIPIIFLTVKDNEEDIIKGFECGAVDYVTKPFNPEILLKRVETHIKLLKTTQELKKLNKNLTKEIEHQVKILREKEQMLFQQSKMAAMGEMIANIAHQWKQPLGAISTAVIALRTKFALESFDFSKEEEQKKCLNYLNEKFDDIENYVENLFLTITDFKNFYKLQKYKEEFDLYETVEKSIKLLQANLDDMNITIKNQVTPTKVLGFSNEFSQVLINLLTNARDALSEDTNNHDKKIEIKSFEDENYINITVNDNATGIKDDIIDKIFEPYFTTKHSEDGTGIGLYMAKEILEKHLAGKITAKNLEKGASFCISLPKFNLIK